MMLKVKICGLQRAEDMEAVNALRPDYVGFVFAESKRKVTEQTAMELKEKLHPQIKAAGVFVNEQPEKIIRLCERKIIDLIQLHGDEDENDIRRLKNGTDTPVIKAVRVRSREQILKAQELPCEYLLLDTYQPGMYGGSGKQFDWNLIPKMEKPYFLAGGLNAQNIWQAVQACNPYAVDVSSAVETDGRKDPKKMKQLMQVIDQIRWRIER